MHAMCTLDGFGKLNPATIELALKDANPAVRRQAVRLAETYAKDAPQLIDAAASLAEDPDPFVRLQLAFTLGEWESPKAARAQATNFALNLPSDDVYFSAAIMSSATIHYAAIADAQSPRTEATSPLTRGICLRWRWRRTEPRIWRPDFCRRSSRLTMGSMRSRSWKHSPTFWMT